MATTSGIMIGSLSAAASSDAGGDTTGMLSGKLARAGIEGRYKSRLAKRDWLHSAIAKLEKGEQQALFAATDVIRRPAES
ncbi:MAG TPA: hypothetical protein VIY90_06105 [Steroidobacteraceae bacterium]